MRETQGSGSLRRKGYNICLYEYVFLKEAMHRHTNISDICDYNYLIHLLFVNFVNALGMVLSVECLLNLEVFICLIALPVSRQTQLKN